MNLKFILIKDIFFQNAFINVKTISALLQLKKWSGQRNLTWETTALRLKKDSFAQSQRLTNVVWSTETHNKHDMRPEERVQNVSRIGPAVSPMQRS